MSYRFLGRKKIWWLIISTALIIPGVLSLIFWGLPLGIDFRGGGNAIWSFEEPTNEQSIREYLGEQGILEGFSVSRSVDESYVVKFLPISEGEYRESFQDISSEFGEIREDKFENVGPSVSGDLTRKAIIAIVVASIFILIYLAYSFRGVTHPVSSWRFGGVALIALVHDLLISIGIFSILANLLNYEVDSSMIAALLTIIGFSVHDTIVVFDRIRENLQGKKIDSQEEFERVADHSLSETLNRSLGTSVTLILTLLALLLLGGITIRPFIVVMMIGVAIGTYSSIFVATPILTIWQDKILKKMAKESPAADSAKNST